MYSTYFQYFSTALGCLVLIYTDVIEKWDKLDNCIIWKVFTEHNDPYWNKPPYDSPNQVFPPEVAFLSSTVGNSLICVQGQIQKILREGIEEIATKRKPSPSSNRMKNGALGTVGHVLFQKY